MIKQIGRIYRIWIILSGNKFEWFWKDLYDFARRALPHTPREAWFPFNPLNRSAGTCFIKTYPFGMIKQIGRIYRIWIILSGNKFEWFWKDLYDFARRALPHTPREAWFPFNPLNRSAGTCFIKTYPFGMIKQIGRIYRIYSNPHTELCKCSKKSLSFCIVLT